MDKDSLVSMLLSGTLDGREKATLSAALERDENLIERALDSMLLESMSQESVTHGVYPYSAHDRDNDEGGDVRVAAFLGSFLCSSKGVTISMQPEDYKKSSLWAAETCVIGHRSAAAVSFSDKYVVKLQGLGIELLRIEDTRHWRLAVDNKALWLSFFQLEEETGNEKLVFVSGHIPQRTSSGALGSGRYILKIEGLEPRCFDLIVQD